jgi:lysozyme family protein
MSKGSRTLRALRISPLGEPGPPFQPGDDYLSVALVAVRMPAGGLGTSKFAPVIWASLRHAGWDGERSLIGLFPNHQAGRPEFARNDRVEVMDLQLTPRVVSQEEVSIEFTLGAVKEKDYLAGALALAGELAASPAAAFVSQLAPAAAVARGAVQTAQAVSKQLAALLDQDRLQALGQFATTLRSPIRSGLFAFVSAEEKASQLRYDGASNQLVGPKGPIKSAYVVIRLQRDASRPDWGALPDLNLAWSRLREAAVSGGDVAAAIRMFRVTALTSPDLTKEDARRVAEAAEARFAPVLDGTETAFVEDVGGMEESLTFFMQTNASDACGAESFMTGGAGLQAASTLMNSVAFSRALQIVLEAEGGFVDHPRDPGGATNMGVTQRIYDDYRKLKGQPKRSVKDLEQTELEEIYFHGFWRPARCPELPNDALAALAFDAAVNHGPQTAIKLLQQAAGVPDAKCDGQWGTDTRAKVTAAAANAAGLAETLLLRRERYYRRLVETNPKLGTFLKGWMARLAMLRARIDPMLAGAPKSRRSDLALLASGGERAPLQAANADFSMWRTEPAKAPAH